MTFLKTLTEKQHQLQEAIPKLSASDAKFASDLIASFAKYQSWTAKQQPWVDKLIAKAASPSPVMSVIGGLGGFNSMLALFKKAKTHLKYPKIVLKVANKITEIPTITVVLSLAGAKSTHAGSIQVVGEGEYPNRPYYGRISPEGQWLPSQKLKEDTNGFQEKLAEMLAKFAQNPVRVAKEFGTLTGACCFCNKTLTDKRSVAAGFGPICAEHFGLKAQWEEAADKAEVKMETVSMVPKLTVPSSDMSKAWKELTAAAAATTFKNPHTGNLHTGIVKKIMKMSDGTPDIQWDTSEVMKNLVTVAEATGEGTPDHIGIMKSHPVTLGWDFAAAEQKVVENMVNKVASTILTGSAGQGCYLCEQGGTLHNQEGYWVCESCLSEMGVGV